MPGSCYTPPRRAQPLLSRIADLMPIPSSPALPLADRLSPHRSARTALFNWLYAKNAAARCCCGSKTPTRAVDRAAIAAILDGLKWLGLDWDGDVIYQFTRPRATRSPKRCWPAQGLLLLRDLGGTDAMREKARRGPHPTL